MKTYGSQLYEQIGNALYAVVTDQHVKPIEQGELKSLIAKDWLPRNTSVEGLVSNEAHCIMMTIDANEADRVTAENAFEDFVSFYQLHKAIFTTDLTKKILDTAAEIAEIFKQDSLTENGRLRDLKALFQDNPLAVKDYARAKNQLIVGDAVK